MFYKLLPRIKRAKENGRKCAKNNSFFAFSNFSWIPELSVVKRTYDQESSKFTPRGRFSQLVTPNYNDLYFHFTVKRTTPTTTTNTNL